MNWYKILNYRSFTIMNKKNILVKKIHKILPILEAVKFYSKSTFRADIIAGITVGVMLIPQGMAYAVLAGLPPV